MVERFINVVGCFVELPWLGVSPRLDIVACRVVFSVDSARLNGGVGEGGDTISSSTGLVELADNLEGGLDLPEGVGVSSLVGMVGPDEFEVCCLWIIIFRLI